MASYDKKLLMKKYGWNGRSMTELMQKIVTQNRVKTAQAVLNSDRRRFEKNLKAMEPKYREKKIVIPDTGNIIKKSPTIIKAADQGKIITDTLREKIRKDVLASMVENGITNKNGTVNKNVTRTLRAKLNKTFDDYTKKDPTFKKPSNVEAIAVTESRTVMSTVRNEYAKEVSESTQKDGWIMTKEWIHNRAPGGMPRASHVALSGTRIYLDDLFKIEDEDGVFYTPHPHAPVLPASQVITCRCELAYRWVKVD
jgi:glucan-binding YG repeat protein